MVSTETIVWYDAERSPPVDGESVLVKTRTGHVFEAFLQHAVWHIYGSSGRMELKGRVSHWAKLPKGPPANTKAAA